MWSGNLWGEFREVSPISPSSDGHEFCAHRHGAGSRPDLHIENFGAYFVEKRTDSLSRLIEVVSTSFQRGLSEAGLSIRHQLNLLFSAVAKVDYICLWSRLENCNQQPSALTKAVAANPER